MRQLHWTIDEETLEYHSVPKLWIITKQHEPHSTNTYFTLSGCGRSLVMLAGNKCTEDTVAECKKQAQEITDELATNLNWLLERD